MITKSTPSLLRGKKMTPNTNHWTDSDWNKFRVWLLDVLKTNTVTVSFTKQDGTERIMKCTLDPSILPKVELTEEKKPRKTNENVVPVFDVESNAWRSFTLKSVNRISLSLG